MGVWKCRLSTLSTSDLRCWTAAKLAPFVPRKWTPAHTGHPGVSCVNNVIPRNIPTHLKPTHPPVDAGGPTAGRKSLANSECDALSPFFFFLRSPLPLSKRPDKSPRVGRVSCTVRAGGHYEAINMCISFPGNTQPFRFPCSPSLPHTHAHPHTAGSLHINRMIRVKVHVHAAPAIK